MSVAVKVWVRRGSIGLTAALLASCGGGVTSSSTNTLNTGNTVTPVGSSAITVNAPALIQASNGALDPVYSCPGDTAHLTPTISWTPGPAGTTYYVVMIDDITAITAPSAANPPTHWLVRTDAATLTLTSATSNLNSAGKPNVASNNYIPPFSNDGNPHTYNVTVYAMNNAWLTDPTQVVATDAGRDFGNTVLPGMNSFPTGTTTASGSVSGVTTGNYYYSGTSNASNGFETLFGAGAPTNFILGQGFATGSYNLGVPSSGC